MGSAPKNDSGERPQIVLKLLESVGRNATVSQRGIAAELGIALGLVNAYLKRCIKKGLVKVGAAPARRYAYYLTPMGFAEKSRLTLEYLTYSFSFFQSAKTDCMAIFELARQRGYQRVVLAGVSDLAEIAVICSLETGVEIVGVVDPQASAGRFVQLPVAASFDDMNSAFDAVIITDLKSTAKTFDAAVARLGRERVLLPSLLDQSAPTDEKDAAEKDAA